MNFNNPNTKNSTTIVRMVCAIVFCLFSFVYLYFYQADILAMAQHVLSAGTRHYNSMVGAVLITLSLFLLQALVFAVLRLEGRFHALTYFPSLLVLAVLTCVSTTIDRGFSFGAWLFVFPLLLVVWAVVAVTFGNYQKYEGVTGGGLFSRSMWINMMAMAMMFFFVGMVSNNDAVFHYRMRAERCMMAGDFDGALNAGRKSLETDRSLTMIRCYALARKGQLGEALFTYPVVGGNDDLLPDSTGAHCMIYSNDSIYRYLGAKPKGRIPTFKFFNALVRRGMAGNGVKDYILCGYLIDRNLDAFVHEISRFYTVDDRLPKHYREALTLYNHLRSNPYIVYRNSVMDTDFEDLQALEKQHSTLSARKVAVNKLYAGTYWWYYEYGR